MEERVKNGGDSPAYNISWDITVAIKQGDIFPGKTLSGRLVDSVEPGQEIIVGQKQIFFRFSSIEIIGTA